MYLVFIYLTTLVKSRTEKKKQLLLQHHHHPLPLGGGHKIGSFLNQKYIIVESDKPK